jgi:cellulose synthase/poly-beta-1,6-N-acetylglucosamine synthase-like glycosyltransferase
MVESDLRPLTRQRPLTSQTPFPRVSILLPFRDAAPTLPACLASIARQTETDWECIALDDGSVDGGGALVKAAARHDPRFTLVSQPPRGLVTSLGAGLEHCRAPVIARMDADDWMHRDRLTEQLALLEAEPGLSALGARVRIFPRAGLTPGRRRYENWLNGLGAWATVRNDAYIECPIAHPTLMIRAEVLRKFGYRALGWPEDYDLVLRLIGAGHRLAVHPRRLLGWRDSPTRLSRQAPEYAQHRFTACKAAHLARGPLAPGSQYLLWGYGSTGRNLRRALLAHGKTPSHIVEVHPRRLGKRIHGAPVVPPEAIPELPPHPLLVSVAGAGPRTEIREALAGMGLHEGRRFFCVA